MDSRRIITILVGALVGGFILYYIGAWTAVLIVRAKSPGSDPSLIVAFLAVPLGLIGMIIGGMLGARRGRSREALAQNASVRVID
jgi:hypothetical protein